MGESFDPYYKWLGIPPKDQPPHHYRLLGIEIFEHDREVIDAAANRLMGYLKDLAVGDEGAHTQTLLNEIARARICLLNKKKKSDYDQKLRGRLKREAAPKPAAKAPPPKVAKRAVPPPATPPSSSVPPLGPKPPAPINGKPSASIGPIPSVTVGPNPPEPDEPLPVLLPDEPEVETAPADAFKIFAQQDKGHRNAAASKPNLVEPDGGNKRGRTVVNPSPSPTGRHGRGVYVAAGLIALVGGIGLILIIIMSYLLLTTESGSGQATSTIQTVDEPPPTIAVETDGQ